MNLLLESAHFFDMKSGIFMSDDLQAKDNDSTADAVAAVFIITLFVVTVVYWVSNQSF